MEWLGKLPWWVKYAFAGGCGFMSTFAGIFSPGWQEFGFLFGAALVGLAVIGTSVHLWQSRSSAPTRIPLLRLRDNALKHGWKFADRDSLDILDFIQGLRQAGQDGQIHFWGRPNRNMFETLTRKELLQETPPRHFVDFTVDMYPLVAVDAPDPVAKDNFYAKTYHNRGTESGYADLHVARAEALRWLKKEANSFRGFTEKRG